MSNSNKKAYFQIDIAFAGILFLLFLSSIYGLQLDKYSEIETQTQITQIKATAKNLCTILSQTQGNPINWNSDLNSIKTIGLINQNQTLNQNKIDQLSESNYLQIKEKLNLDKYNFNIKIINTQNQNIETNFGYESKIQSLSQKYSCYSNQNQIIKQILVEVWK